MTQKPILALFTLLGLMLPSPPLFSATNDPATPAPSKSTSRGDVSAAQARAHVLAFLKSRGHGSYLFGQVATWVHNENPDLDHPGQLDQEGAGSHRPDSPLRLHHL
jgi:hypothetical protein